MGRQFKKINGFTLIELMIVVGVVGILAAVAYPSYQNSVMKSNRDSAKSGLTLLSAEMTRAKTLSATNNYDNLTQGDGSPIATLFPSQLPLDAATKTYDITISVSENSSSYTLTATPIDDELMDGDGTLTLSSTGAKTWNGNNGWD